MNYSKYFPIVEYYKRVVQPINPAHYRVKSDKMMVCPLHGDINPSMGVVVGSTGEQYHCFGCGKWGDVVDLHMKVSRRLLKKHLSEEESLKDLCRIFNVDYAALPNERVEEELSRSALQEKAIIEAKGKFDYSDYNEMITEGKLKKKGVPYFNTLLMIMIGELKSKEARDG